MNQGTVEAFDHDVCHLGVANQQPSGWWSKRQANLRTNGGIQLIKELKP